MLINSTACQRPGVFFSISDINCTKQADGHYQWKPCIEKNTLSTELRTIDWPSDMTEWIDFYLRAIRPRICDLNGLSEVPEEWWLNTRGVPMRPETGREWFKTFLHDTIGVEMHFRDYRWNQCSHENAYPSSPEEHERFLYLSDHTQGTVDLYYRVIRDLPQEDGKYATLSFNQNLRGLDSVSIGYSLEEEEEEEALKEKVS